MNTNEVLEWYEQIDWSEYRTMYHARNKYPVLPELQIWGEPAVKNGWYYEPTFRSFRHYVNDSLYKEDGPCVISKGAVHFNHSTDIYNINPTHAYDDGTCSFTDKEGRSHGPYVHHHVNILRYKQYKRYHIDEMEIWRIHEKRMPVYQWMVEMDMDVYNLSTEEKLLCHMKWD